VLQIGNGAREIFSRYRPAEAGDGRSCLIGVRPEHIEPAGEAAGDDVIVGEIERHVFLGNLSRVVLRVDGHKLVVELRGGPGTRLDPGSRLAVRIPADAVHHLGEVER
jgi:ABC-type Fe3+/spermidine/putrescine transport system ATPase subunit